MKSFRNIAIASILSLGTLGAVMVTSCKNKCGSTTCQNGGSCSESVCICPTGFSGTSCQYSWTSIVVGTYNCSRANCTPSEGGVNSWQSTVVTDATYGGYTVDISNFDNTNIIAYATVDSATGNLSNMSISNTTGIDAKGTYNSTNGVINLRYTTYYAGVAGTTCNMIMTKIQ